MAAKSLREQLSDEELIERTQESHKTMNEFGKFGKFYGPIPGGRELKNWVCKEGEHVVDIIPFISGNKNPRVAPGKPAYVVDVWVHKNVGVLENDYLCPLRNYSRPCPFCEYTQQLRLNLGDDKNKEDLTYIKSFEAKRRCLYNIVCYDSVREQDAGVQIWEIAHFLFEKKILAIARDPRTHGFIPFPCVNTGSSICFQREGSGAGNTQYLGHRFLKRAHSIPEHIIESTYCLDELLIEMPYDKLKEELLMGLSGGIEEDPAEKRDPLQPQQVDSDTFNMGLHDQKLEDDVPLEAHQNQQPAPGLEEQPTKEAIGEQRPSSPPERRAASVPSSRQKRPPTFGQRRRF
jgi:hypothetical protein